MTSSYAWELPKTNTQILPGMCVCVCWRFDANGSYRRHEYRRPHFCPRVWRNSRIYEAATRNFGLHSAKKAALPFEGRQSVKRVEFISLYAIQRPRLVPAKLTATSVADYKINLFSTVVLWITRQRRLTLGTQLTSTGESRVQDTTIFSVTNGAFWCATTQSYVIHVTESVSIFLNASAAVSSAGTASSPSAVLNTPRCTTRAIVQRNTLNTYIILQVLS